MKCENFPPLWTWQKQNKDKLQVIFYYSGEETKPSYDLSLCIRVVAIFPSYYKKQTNKQAEMPMSQRTKWESRRAQFPAWQLVTLLSQGRSHSFGRS